ncbi:uncharacterized protein LOC129960375 [Argiope bruennichi]|uniref:uncharacterized protein LOC129960375 n=1 Tax=Argiope bruennichi TaxID=94029 RepID=UPI00249428F5|nr:uncharacterized protein LOC129960375 [Argiope bruennichi]
MTIIDRFTRWPEVITTPDMTAETTARALMNGWISRFGCPVTITTDQGTNFQSNLFRELTRMLGCNRIRSASYHPQANGIIERLHRHLKSALKAHNNRKWTEILPIVLLGLRSALKEDINAPCAQLVYGTTLRLPSDLVTSGPINQTINTTYVNNLTLNWGHDADQPEPSKSQPILEKSAVPPNPTKPSTITRYGSTVRFPKHLVTDYIVF